MDYMEAFWTPILTLISILLLMGTIGYGAYLMFKHANLYIVNPFMIYSIHPKPTDPDDFDSYPEDM